MELTQYGFFDDESPRHRVGAALYTCPVVIGPGQVGLPAPLRGLPRPQTAITKGNISNTLEPDYRLREQPVRAERPVG